MKSRQRQHETEGNYFSHASHATARRQPPGGDAFSEDNHDLQLPSPDGNADRPSISPGDARRPAEQALSESPSQHAQPGQYGYGLGGEAHDNWGAFGGNVMPQDPGEGQDEPWQHDRDGDYLQWRAEHVRQLDEDYARWGSERFGKFAEEFSQWRDRHTATRNKSPAGSPHQSQPVDAHPQRDATALKGKLK